MMNAALIADARFDLVCAWMTSTLGTGAYSIAPASADASFRRYFRITPQAPWRGHATLVAMDAPPPMENCRPFVHVAALLADAGVHAPAVLAADLDCGLLLLTDLGNRTYLAALDTESAPQLYSDAIDALIRWHSDNHTLYVYQRGELPIKIYRLDVETGRREFWKELLPADMTGVVPSFPQIKITPDGKSYAYSYYRNLSQLYLVEGLK